MSSNGGYMTGADATGNRGKGKVMVNRSGMKTGKATQRDTKGGAAGSSALGAKKVRSTGHSTKVANQNPRT